MTMLMVAVPIGVMERRGWLMGLPEDYSRRLPACLLSVGVFRLMQLICFYFVLLLLRFIKVDTYKTVFIHSVDWVATTAVRCCVTPCYLRGLLSLPTGNTHTHTPFFGCITHRLSTRQQLKCVLAKCRRERERCPIFVDDLENVCPHHCRHTHTFSHNGSPWQPPSPLDQQITLSAAAVVGLPACLPH